MLCLVMQKEELEANEGGNGRASSFFDKLRCKTNRTKKYIDASIDKNESRFVGMEVCDN